MINWNNRQVLRVIFRDRLFDCKKRISIDAPKSMVTELLEELGQNVVQSDGRFSDFLTNEILFIVGNANWFPKICAKLASTPESKRPFTVIWHFEPLPPPNVPGLPKQHLHLREIAKIVLKDSRATDVYTNYFRLRELAKKGIPDLLIVSSLSWKLFLDEKNIDSHYVPRGYHPSDGYDMGLVRDIDVLFLGMSNIPRRNRVLKYLQKKGIRVLSMGNWHDPSCWGENRTRLLNRAKIFLNIQRYAGEQAGPRLILGMANKTLIISEPIYRAEPFVAGKHYISTGIDDMPHVIRHCIEHYAECQDIIGAGHRFVVKELTMKSSLTQILDLIKSRLRVDTFSANPSLR